MTASREPRTSQSSALLTEPLCLALEHNTVTASGEPRTSQSSALPTEPLCLALEHNTVTLLAESLEQASLVLYQLSHCVLL